MTLVEVVIAMAVLGIVLVSLLQGAATSVGMQRTTLERVHATLLARELAESVCALPYKEGAAIGIDVGEVAGDKATFDDLDDFHAWSESPPQRPDGTAMPGFDAWTREVTVDFVDPSDPAAAAGGDQGAKLVRVRVSRDSELVATLERVRYLTMEGATE
jgi:hypothetical protein